MIGLVLGLLCGAAVGQGVTAPAVPPVTAPVATAPGVERKPSNDAAARLVYQAGAALRAGDKEDAEKQLGEAKALNEEELRLWSTYGYLHAAQGEKATAIDDFQREIALHPEVTEAYQPLAELQDGLGRRADEEVTLAKLIKVEARTPAASARLVHMLVEDGKAADAVKLGQDSAARYADAVKKDARLNPRAVDGLEFELSKAQLAAGMKAESLATMVALLKVTKNPAVLNDGAYRLAEEGTELPLAEKSALAALPLAELTSRRMTLDTKVEVSRVVMADVSAVWDTVGWVLYREGKLDEAESYLRPAWLQRQSVAVGEHLAEIEAARGDKNLALTVCDVTLAAEAKAKAAKEQAAAVKVGDAKAGDAKVAEAPKLSAEAQVVADKNAAEAAKTAAADLAKLQAKADELKGGGAVSKGQAGMKEMLTSPITLLRPATGTGEFVVMMGFGIVELATNGTAKTNAVGMLSGLVGAKVTAGIWPKGSGAKLMMKASLSCKGTACVMVLGDL